MKQMVKDMMGSPTVIVHRTMVKGKKMYEVKEIEPRAGWLIGYRNIMVEWTIHGGYEDGRYSSPVRRQDVYQVLFCPIHRPVLVPKDGLKFNAEGLTASQWSPQRRRLFSAEMKKWFDNPGFAIDRDALGRFV